MRHRQHRQPHSRRLLSCLVLLFASSCLIAPAQCGASIARAAYDGKLSKVAKYLDSGKGSVQDTFSDGDCTACNLLHYAAAGGQIAVARLLLEHGADVNAPSGKGWTPLYLACKHLNVQMATFLLEKGAAPSLRVHDPDVGATPLLAAAYGSMEGTATARCRPVILANGVAYTVCGDTKKPVGDQEALVDALLAAGADPNDPTKAGNTPLHIAAYRGYPAVVRLLLSKGADPSRINVDGETARQLAVRYQQAEVLRVLREWEP